MIFRALFPVLLAAALFAPGAVAAPEPQPELAPEGAPLSPEGKAEARDALFDALFADLAEAEDEEAGSDTDRAVVSLDIL